ncbi:MULTISPECIES: glycosyltransferase [Hymenobacter]|nr:MULTISPECIES: cellulose synthase catalytic subunit [unclassified Hymenobacter]
MVVSLTYKVLWILHEWFHYVQISAPVPPAYPTRLRTVDMLTTACPGEPHAMIIGTLEAMQAVRYPHTSYLCDEGDDPVLRAACARLGVVHVTRLLKTDAKAGNINNALRQATGELCVVLDPDHAPTPDFLDHVTPYFEDDSVGYVQVVQAYGNQADSLVARGAAEQTYHFYGPLMMGMNAYDTVQAIGANCTFRRAALDSIGGHAAGLTEDMHTAMRLHAAGWQSAYVPQIVSRGLVPSSLAAFYAQQLKWSRGAFDLLFRVYPKLFGRFSWAQRLHYLLLPLYFLSGAITLIDFILPILCLYLSQLPLITRLIDLAQYTLPFLIVSLLIHQQAQRWLREPSERGMHWAGNFLQVSTWWVYTLGLLYAIAGVRVPYIPTPKEGRQSNEWGLAIPNLLLIALLLGACVYGRSAAPGYYTNLMVYLALFNVLLLTGAVGLGLHEVVHWLRQRLTTQPLRWFTLAVYQGLARIGTALLLGVQRYSPGAALLLLVAFGLISYLRHDQLSRQPSGWLLTGANSVHLGWAADRPGSLLSYPARHWWQFTASATPYAIAALPFAATEPIPEATRQLARHQVPLLSWAVRSADTWQPDYWLPLARQVASLPSPVMLRPNLSAPTASAYRRAWQHMVRSFKQAHVTNAVWVWTPEATDSLFQRFPGSAYTDWLACRLQGQGDMASYAALRPLMAQDILLHDLPVLLLAPTPAANPTQAGQRLSQLYPELKAIVFASPQRLMPLTAHTRPSAACQ